MHRDVDVDQSYSEAHPCRGFGADWTLTKATVKRTHAADLAQTAQSALKLAKAQGSCTQQAAPRLVFNKVFTIVA
jgi:hypothetical protein